jgi:hypothetical protein
MLLGLCGVHDSHTRWLVVNALCCTGGGGGLLSLPALFALADFHMFSVIYAALSCIERASFAG